MVGCVTEAIEIASWDMELDEHDEWYDIPEGWTYLGEGEYRAAFLSPSGIVYKREINDGAWFGHNTTEYKYICKARLIPVQGWRVPDSSLYDVPVGYSMVTVIAMEFIGGEFDTYCELNYKKKCTCGKPDGKCTYYAWLEVMEAWGVSDVHRGNIRVQHDGTRVLIDAAGDSDDEDFFEEAA
jgi:hypothetical protein